MTVKARRGIPVISVTSVILSHEKTKIQKLIGCENFDVLSVYYHTYTTTEQSFWKRASRASVSFKIVLCTIVFEYMSL